MMCASRLTFMSRGVRVALVGVLMFACIGEASAKSLSTVNKERFFKKADGGEGALAASPFAPKRLRDDQLKVDQLRLTGVVIGATQAFAMISGNAYQLGDRIAQYRLTQIDTDTVLLKKREKSIRLRVGEGGAQ